MDDVIEKYYIKYNFPNNQRLYTFMKNDNLKVTHKQIKDYINDKVEAQLLKMSKPTKRRMGHITAITDGDSAQMDIYDLSKYKNYNKQYKYMFVLIDVFTRKAYIRPMKSKNSEDVIKALVSIIENYKYKPHVIISDTDKAFISDATQATFNEYDIIHSPVIARDDHRALGIVDRFALTLKLILSKMYIINKSTNWIDHIEEVIDKYNNTPHSSLEELTPQEATKDENQHAVAEINRNKATKEPIKPLFNQGDKVRIRINKTFRKGTEPRYSDSLYTVQKVNGQRITLNSGKILLESELLKIDSLGNNETNIIDTVNKENRTSRRLKKAGMIQADIVETKRERKPNKKYF